MRAISLFKEKRLIAHSKSGALAVAELKIWHVPVDKYYKSGRKFSLFLVLEGQIIIGIDNHRPKGPHLHLDGEEFPYNYKNDDILIDDFWDFVRKAGFNL